MSNQAERFARGRVDCPRCNGTKRTEQRITPTVTLPCDCPDCRGTGKVNRKEARRIARALASQPGANGASTRC